MPRVFIVGDNNVLTKMDKTEFALETDLQSLIARHPALLESCTSETHEEERKLLLVRREMGVPDREDGADRWAMDHFYIDQAGVPTLVEVKRSRNGQLRREVVGQLLDYAANAAAYWTLEDIRARFVQNWGADRAPAVLEEFLAGTEFEANEDGFWQRVKSKLEATEIRLVFVAEELPPQLKRVIEFLNEQMRRVEVLGVELGHFSDGVSKAIVPSIVGRTTQAEATKGRGSQQAKSYEFLDSVVEQFRAIAGTRMGVSDHTGHYRQVRLDVGVEKGVHYEFQSFAKLGITCEFHVEVGPRPALQAAMRKLEGVEVDGRKIEYKLTGKNGMLRLVPAEQSDPAGPARTMLRLIDLTHDSLKAAALDPAR